MSHFCGFLYSHTPPEYLKEIGCEWVAIKPQIIHITFHFFAESRLQRKREKYAISIRKEIMAIDPMANGNPGPHEVVCNK